MAQFLFITIFRICVRYVVYLLLSLLFTPLFWISYLIIQYTMYVSCIICMNCALFLIVRFIEYLVWMSDWSNLIDKLNDDEVVYSAEFTIVCDSGVVGASSPIASRKVLQPSVRITSTSVTMVFQAVWWIAKLHWFIDFDQRSGAENERILLLE